MQESSGLVMRVLLRLAVVPYERRERRTFRYADDARGGVPAAGAAAPVG